MGTITATLFLPQQQPLAVSIDGLALPEPKRGFAAVTERITELLGCAPNLVDVLASGADYVAYSVFDCDGPVNRAGMAAVAEVSGVAFDADDADAILCGPVLVVSALKH